MIWYVGYGSNLDRDRFLFYLLGGQPPGARRGVPGSREPVPPVDERAVVVPGRLFFGWESTTWGGGVGFLDADADDTAYGRAYRLTETQLADVAAQEMHGRPGEDLDLTEVLAHRRHARGAGRYETLHLLGELDGEPMITFSADEPAALGLTSPSARYLGLVARGLRHTHDLDDAQIAAHLASRPGAAGAWTEADVLDLLARDDGPSQD